jgi:hypothetical protein
MAAQRKTKYLGIFTYQNNSFTYLGSSITKDGGCSEDIK